MPRYDEIFKKALNDTDIFDSPTDGSIKVPKLFEGDSWEELKTIYYSDKQTRQESFYSLVNKRLLEVSKKFEDELKNNKRYKKEFENYKNALKKCADWLKKSYTENTSLLELTFKNLEWYGVVECKLPKMDNYGRVVEKFPFETVETYFSDKIKSISGYKQLALKKVLGYIEELYSAKVSVEQIAYFVRKLDSLIVFWEFISTGVNSRRRG